MKLVCGSDAMCSNGTIVLLRTKADGHAFTELPWESIESNAMTSDHIEVDYKCHKMGDSTQPNLQVSCEKLQSFGCSLLF